MTHGLTERLQIGDRVFLLQIEVESGCSRVELFESGRVIAVGEFSEDMTQLEHTEVLKRVLALHRKNALE